MSGPTTMEAPAGLRSRVRLPRPGRADVLAASLCIGCGLLLSLLPNLLWGARTGDFTWVEDVDEVVYLAYAARSYAEHPLYVADGVVREGGAPALAPWLQYFPYVAAARALDLGPMGISLLWRVGAGLGVPLGWYVALRQFIRRPWIAAGLTVVLMCDPGLLTGKPLLTQARATADLLAGRGDWLVGRFTSSDTNYNWRTTTPGVVSLYLLLFVGLLARARNAPSRGSIVAAGSAFGLLFYAYLFYWTAAGLALALGVLVDRGKRRVYLRAGCIGGLIGLPALVSILAYKSGGSAEASHRSDLMLPIPHLSEIFLSSPETALLAIALTWVWLRRRDLMPPALTALAGWLLTNHQVASGLQTQNYHFRTHVSKPITWLTLVILAAQAAFSARPRRAAWCLSVLAGLSLGSGLYLRAMEATRARGAVEQTGAYHAYRAQRLAPGAPRLAPDATVAGPEDFVSWAVILEDQRPLDHYLITCSTAVDTREWTERVALNAFLSGQEAGSYEAEQRETAGGWWGPWKRDPARKAELVSGRLAAFEAIAADPGPALDRFGVRHVGLPSGQTPPDYLRAGGWRRIEAGPRWQIWERPAAHPAARREAR